MATSTDTRISSGAGLRKPPLVVLNIEAFPPVECPDFSVFNSAVMRAFVVSGRLPFGTNRSRIEIGITEERILTITEVPLAEATISDCTPSKLFQRAIALPKAVDETQIQSFVKRDGPTVTLELYLPKRGYCSNVNPLKRRMDDATSETAGTRHLGQYHAVEDFHAGIKERLAEPEDLQHPHKYYAIAV